MVILKAFLSADFVFDFIILKEFLILSSLFMRQSYKIGHNHENDQSRF